MSEQVLDVETWPEEAQAAINDIKNHVKSASISKLNCTNQKVYLNLTTLENKQFCVEMNSEGFKIVGRQYDDASIQDNVVYETPYALLNAISEKFKKSFGGELTSKLMDLIKNNHNGSSE